MRFFDEHPNQGSAARDIRFSIDKIKANVKWMESSFASLSDWLANGQTVVEQPKLDYRLPTDLLPSHYDVFVSFQFENEFDDSFPYDGEVKIDFRCIKDTSKLVLHIHDLDIDNSSLVLSSTTDSSFGVLREFNWYNDFTREFFVADLTKQLKAGQNYSLSMKFIGYLTDDLRGFYRSSYMINNKEKWLMTSQLESTDARKSFPCFDEPIMKATFTIGVEHPCNYTALSNMPIANVMQLYLNFFFNVKNIYLFIFKYFFKVKMDEFIQIFKLHQLCHHI